MNHKTTISIGKKTILFIHHSTGGNLIKEGNLRTKITKLNPKIELWDHNYNLSPVLPTLLAKVTHLKGLSDPSGKVTGRDYNINISNNSPKEYAAIFARDTRNPTLKAILGYNVIAFKNCYPTTKIVSDQQLADDVRYYTVIRESIKKYPRKHFVVLTPPPTRKATTNTQNAKRAIKLVNWLNSKAFTNGVTNIYIFDLFTLLADKNGMLKKEYERLVPWDSHPNQKANLAVAPVFAKFLVKVSDGKNIK